MGRMNRGKFPLRAAFAGGWGLCSSFPWTSVFPMGGEGPSGGVWVTRDVILCPQALSHTPELQRPRLLALKITETPGSFGLKCHSPRTDMYSCRLLGTYGNG